MACWSVDSRRRQWPNRLPFFYTKCFATRLLPGHLRLMAAVQVLDVEKMLFDVGKMSMIAKDVKREKPSSIEQLIEAGGAGAGGRVH